MSAGMTQPRTDWDDHSHHTQQEHYVPNDHYGDLVARLAARDITYLHRPTGDEPNIAKVWRSDEISRLAHDLAQSSDSRLRYALVALLLVHPEDLAAVRFAPYLAEPPDRLWVEACILAAAALETRWWFSLWVYNRYRVPMDVEAEAHRWGIGSVRVAYGEDALAAVAALLSEGQPFPVNYVGQWEDAAQHALGILRTSSGRAA